LLIGQILHIRLSSLHLCNILPGSLSPYHVLNALYQPYVSKVYQNRTDDGGELGLALYRLHHHLYFLDSLSLFTASTLLEKLQDGGQEVKIKL